jgi:hypothetical protein
MFKEQELQRKINKERKGITKIGQRDYEVST